MYASQMVLSLLNFLPCFCSFPVQVSVMSFLHYSSFFSLFPLVDFSATALNFLLSIFIFHLLSISWSFPFLGLSLSIFLYLPYVFRGFPCPFRTPIITLFLQHSDFKLLSNWVFPDLWSLCFVSFFVFKHWLLMVWSEEIGKDLPSPSLDWHFRSQLVELVSSPATQLLRALVGSCALFSHKGASLPFACKDWWHLERRKQNLSVTEG